MNSDSIVNSISNFLKLSAKEKLSVIADIVTILGISVATFVAGPFLVEITGLGFDIKEFIWAIVFYSIAGLIVISMVIAFLSEFEKTEEKKTSGETFITIILYLVMCAIFFSISPWVKDYVGDITNSRYLLPPSAKSAVNEINGTFIEDTGGAKILKGKVFLNKNTDFKDYSVVLYTLNNDSGTYYYRSYKFGKYSVELNRSGAFSIPLNSGISLESPSYIVVYRKLDSNRLLGDLFPNDITQIPSLSMEELEAYAEKIKLGSIKPPT